MHQFELAPCPFQVACQSFGRDTLEVAEGLEQHDLEAEVGADALDVGG